MRLPVGGGGGGRVLAPLELIDALCITKFQLLSLLLYLLFYFNKCHLFSLMKSKEMAVRGPTDSGRPPVIGFY